VALLKTSIERYILWLAPALVIRAVATTYSGVHGLELLAAPMVFFLVSPAEAITYLSLLRLLPEIVTAIWIYRDSSGSLVVRLAWSVSAFFLSYFVLIPYIGAQLLDEKRSRPARLAAKE